MIKIMSDPQNQLSIIKRKNKDECDGILRLAQKSEYTEKRDSLCWVYW